MKKTFITSSSFWDNIEHNKKLVEQEAKLIKKHFTSEEIDKLQLELIDGDDRHHCIYGLMVGTCNSDRVYDFIKNNINVLIKSFNFNGVNIDNIDVEKRAHDYFVTPLEEYIITQDFDEVDEDDCNNDVLHRIEEVYNWIKND
jgi:hypothetical protein